MKRSLTLSITFVTALCVALVTLAADPNPVSAQRGRLTGRSQTAGPKIYISADMEGLAGAVSSAQLGPAGFEYNAYRKIMTEEVLAAIEGARAAGAGEIVVSDSHGNGQNIIPDMLPDDVLLIRSWPRPLMMMEGIDASFDGVILIGYHAGTTSPEGVRAHTMSSTNLTDIRLNGRSVNEAHINAAIAGHFNVPIIMITGDDVVAAETTALLGNIETAVVKEAISYESARGITPKAAREMIREKAERAVARIGEFRPWRLTGQIALEIQMKNWRPGELLAYLPVFERIDAHAVRYLAQDMVEVSKVIEFVLNYRVDITP
jgi:D-amino peptidase